MQINSNTVNSPSQAYSKSNITQSTNNTNIPENTNDKESISLNIQDSKQMLSSNDTDAIRAKIEEISEKLSIDYSEESSNFSKNNVNFFEGSLLTAQSSNIKDSVAGLLSE